MVGVSILHDLNNEIIGTCFMKSIIYFILNIKMTTPSLANFCIELLAAAQTSSSVKFDNDNDLIFMLRM